MPHSPKDPRTLQLLAHEMRADIIRMLHEAGSGHPGGSLSAIDLLTVLFYNHLERTAENALAKDRHRFILSKGHGVPAVYALFAKMGIIEPAELMTLRKLGSRLQGHPYNVMLPEVEASTGSLGQGLSIAQGMAMAAKIEHTDIRVYALLGDGEFQEGQIWESLLSAPKFGLDNLTVILDFNKGQIDGPTSEVMNIEPVVDKVQSFNWEVQRIDGHDVAAIDAALTNTHARNGKPHFIVADTMKGKGVSFMEHPNEWHGKTPNAGETARALAEIDVLIHQAASVLS